MTPIELEAEYNNRVRVPDNARVLDQWAQRASSYREAARWEGDTPYGRGDREKLDYFFPVGPENLSAVFLIIHGGYWQMLDRRWISHFAQGVNARGFVAALPSYDLAPAVTLKHIISQIRHACETVWVRFQRPIVVCGHSAGAHLGATLMSHDRGTPLPYVRAGALISGVFDLVPLTMTTINRAVGLNVAEAGALSPIHWTPSASRLVTVVGGDESSELKRQSRELTEVWGRAMSASHLEIAGAHHFDVIDGLSEPDSTLVQYLAALAEPGAI